MSQLYEDKNPLEDKRDEKFIQIKSSTYFFEMFKKKNKKSQEIIPHTILWESGNPNMWFFNTTKGKTHSILYKNQEKVNQFELCKFFLGVTRPEELRIDNLSALAEYSKKLSQVRIQFLTNKQNDMISQPVVIICFCALQTQPICYVRYLDKKTDVLTGSDLVKLFIEGKQSSNISMIQSYIPKSPKASEVHYVEYRHDDNTMPLGFKFFKKTLSTKKSYASTAQNFGGEIPGNNGDTKESGSGSTGKKEVIIGKKLFFKCFDSSLNSKLQENVKRIIEFIEVAYSLKVRKFTPKFMIDLYGNIIFIGIKHLFIELYQDSPYDIDLIKENKSMTFTEFRKLLKLSKKSNFAKIGGVQMRLPAVIHQDDKKYSATLYKKMRVEKCGGDFCDYEMLEKNTGPLAMRKNILEEYKKHFGVRKEQLENIALSLPYEISNQLILKTREHALAVIDILRRNKIFSKESSIVKSQNYHFSTDDNFAGIDVQVEYPFMHKSYTVDNFENLYKRIKICKSCFIIYSLTSKHFDEKLRDQLRQSASSQSTKNFFFKRQSSSNQLQVGNNTINIANAATSGNDQDQTQESANIIKQPNKEDQQLSKSQSQMNFPRKPLGEHTRNGSYRIAPLSVNNKPQVGLPETRISKARLLPNTRKDIEVNRLTLGFLNYEKLRDLYKEPVDAKPRNSISQNDLKQLQIKKQAINLLEKPTKDLKRKDINADSYLLFKLAEDRKNLRKNITSDSQMRQVLLSKLSTAQQEGQKPFLIQTNSLYYNHANFQHLRKLHKYKISSPINPFFDELDIAQVQELTLAKVCAVMGYPQPALDTSDMKFLVIDENTAVPYCLLGSTQQQEGIQNNHDNLPVEHQSPNIISDQGKRENSPNKGDNNLQEEGNDVIVFLQDFFDSFFEYKQLFEEIVAQRGNQKVLLLNLPGQSYTIYNGELLYPNYYQIEVIDRLLFKLDSEKLINTKTDRFKFIGIGYGGFILQSYMVSAYGNLPNLGSLLLINSFIEVDNILKDTLLKSLEIFETCPEGMEDLSFNYFSVIVNSQALSEEQLAYKMKLNPILNDGRVAIIQGCLASQFMRDRFEKVPVSCFIVHTLKNCVVNINQSDLLAKYSKDEVSDFQAHLILKKINEKQVKRKIKYINGGHSLLEENAPQLVELIDTFLKDQF